MLRSSCQEVADSMGADIARLSEAARLRLEQHLEECADCRRDLATSRGARDLFVESSPTLSDVARERALSRALAKAEGGKVVSLPARSRGWMIGGVTACAAAAALVMWYAGEQTNVPARPVAETRVQTPATVAEPEVPSTSDTSSSESWIDANTPRTLHFAHAKVELSQGTRLTFDAKSAVLTLSAGRVDVDVDPSVGKPFWVFTQRFRVQVLGTQFSVTPEQVSVREGHVQVSDHQGRVLARDLAAGTSFSVQEAHAAQEARKGTSLAEGSKREQTRDIGQLLSQVRKTMAQGRTDAATQLLKSLTGDALTRPQRAEAATLRAEISLLEQKPTQALQEYEELARRFRDLPAGENAAFAAAQLAARHAPGRERGLLEGYLQRYPKGRFADEVKGKLGTK